MERTPRSASSPLYVSLLATLVLATSVEAADRGSRGSQAPSRPSPSSTPSAPSAPRPSAPSRPAPSAPAPSRPSSPSVGSGFGSSGRGYSAPAPTPAPEVRTRTPDRGRSSEGRSFESPARPSDSGWGSGSGRARGNSSGGTAPAVTPAPTRYSAPSPAAPAPTVTTPRAQPRSAPDREPAPSSPSPSSSRYQPRVWESDTELVWRTKPQPAPIPRVSSSSRADGNASLSRARLERANGAPLVGGVGARVEPTEMPTTKELPGTRGMTTTRSSTSEIEPKQVLDRYQRTRAQTETTTKTTTRVAPSESPSYRRGARAQAAAVAPTVTRAQPRPEATQRAAAKHVDELRRVQPEEARRIERTAAQVANTTHVASRVTLGVAVGAWTGCSTNWWWPAYDKSCNWTNPWWNWHLTWSKSCGWNFGLGWSSCWNPCWSYSSYYSPYSYSYYPAYYWYPSVVWCYDPVVIERVVEREVVVYEDAGERAAAPVAVGEAVVASAEPTPAKEITDALTVAAKKHLDEGDAAFREGRYADAVHHYARALECSPNDAGLHLVLADALFATGDYHYCAWSLRRALELDPKALDTDVDKHEFYNDKAEFDRQLALAESYLEDHFLDDDARLVLAFNYHCARRHDEAAALLESAFSTAVRESPAGAKVLERARAARSRG